MTTLVATRPAVDDSTESESSRDGTCRPPVAPRPCRSGQSPMPPSPDRSGCLGEPYPLGSRSSAAARFVAPDRFDVHVVSEFEAWVERATVRGERRLVVDCAHVDFIDVAIIEAITAAQRTSIVELADMSLASMITFRLLETATPVEPLELAA